MESPREARRFVRQALASWGLDDPGGVVEAIVGEMAVNAVLHGRTPYVVVVRSDDGGSVRVEVHDGNPDAPRQKATTPQGPLLHGRGLAIIEGSASRWGVELTGDGKCVWAEVDG